MYTRTHTHTHEHREGGRGIRTNIIDEARESENHLNANNDVEEVDRVKSLVVLVLLNFEDVEQTHKEEYDGINHRHDDEWNPPNVPHLAIELEVPLSSEDLVSELNDPEMGRQFRW